MEFFLKIAAVKSIVVYVFLLTIFLLLAIKTFFPSKVIEQETQKLIGGLVVFVFAIISENPYIGLVSLFIGGLIIASEDFLQTLAVIFKSNDETLPDSLTALKAERASKQEVEEKQEEEADIAQADILEKQKDTKIEDFVERRRAYLNTIKKVERAATSFFYEKYGSRFQSQVKITSVLGDIYIADGVLKNDKGEIRAIVEFKYFKRIPSNGRHALVRETSKIRLLFPNIAIYYVVIYDKENKEEGLMQGLSRLVGDSFKLDRVKIFPLSLNCDEREYSVSSETFY